MFTRFLTIHKYQLTLILVFGLSLLTVRCGSQVVIPAATRTTEIRFEAEPTPEIRLVASEQVPLNNCNGNSALRMAVERSREFEHTVMDKNGLKFGGTYGFLTGLLEKEYSVVDGEKETQTHTVFLETKAHSHVIYTIAWKESWLNGQVVIQKSGGGQ